MAHRIRQIRYREGDEPIPGYRLVRWLGEGGMGEVWKARSAGGIEVAMKILYGVQEKAGRKELRALQLVKSIRHPNLVPITAFWLKDEDGNVLDESDSVDMDGPSEARDPRAARDLLTKTLDIASVDTDLEEVGDIRKTPAKGAAQLIIAMGLGDGNLFGRLEECQLEGREGIPPDELLDYMEDAAKAIDFLNIKHGIQHCDIKPQNILVVGEAGQVCDFGLAKSLQDTRRTSTNAVTIAYGAPEVMMKGEPSRTTDQYSLAMSYIELRTGKLPFESDTMTGVIDAKRTGELDMSRVPEVEREVLCRATALRPDERYPTNLEFVRHLRRVYELSTAPPPPAADPIEPWIHQAPPPPPPAEEPIPHRPSRAKYVALLVALLLVAAASALFVIPGTDGRALLYSLLPSRSNLHREQVMALVMAGKFAEAHALLEQLDESERPEVAEYISGAWLAAAKQVTPDEALDHAHAILEHFPEHPGALEFRRERLETQLLDAESALSGSAASTDILDRADEQLRTIAAELPHVDAPYNEQLLARVQLARARLVARRDAERWSDLQPLLDQVAARQASLAARDQAHLLALRVLQMSGQGTVPLLSSLEPLVTSDELLSKLDRWEADQIQAVKDSLQEAIDWEALDEQQLAQVTTIWPQYRQDLRLMRADGHRRSAVKALAAGDQSQAEQHLDHARRLLEEAHQAAEDESARQLVRVAQSQLDLFDPRVMADQALAAFNLAALPAQPQLAELCAALAQRVQQQPDLAQRALEAIGSLHQQVPVAVQEQLAEPYADVLSTHLLQPGHEPLDYAALQQHCDRLLQAGSSPPLVAAGWAEAALSMSEQADVGQWQQAEEIFQPVIDHLSDQPHTNGADYLLYVRSLLLHRNPLNPDPLTAAQDAQQALTTASTSGALEHPARRRALATLLADAAARLRTGVDAGLAQPAYTPQAAEIAYQYLNQAQHLGLASSEMAMNLALAAAYREPVQWDEVGKLVEQALAEGKPTAQLLLVSARSLAQAEQPTAQLLAAQHYGQLLDQLVDAPAENRLPPLELYQTVVEPALKLTDQFKTAADVPAELKQPLARLYATRARLIHKEPVVSATILPAAGAGGNTTTTPAKVAYQDYARAYTIHPLPEYLVGQGEALIERTDVESTAKLDELLKLVDQALAGTSSPKDLPPTSRLRGAFRLKGHALLMQSRATTDFERSSQLLKQAIAIYGELISSTEPTAELAEYLVGRSASLLELVFYTEKMPNQDNDQQREWLTQAALDADQASQIREYHRPDHAYLAWGNAEEDLALYVESAVNNKQAEAKHYQQALDWFQSAVLAASRINQSTTAGYMALGRARFRRAEVAKNLVSPANMRQELQRAIDDLNEALDEAGPSEVPEVHLWLSQAFKAADKMEEARKHAELAAQLALQYNKLRWPEYQLSSIQLATAEKKPQLGTELIDVATKGDLGYQVHPVYLAGAVNAVVAAQSSVEGIVQAVGDHLALFPEDDPLTRLYRFNLLFVRIHAVVNVDNVSVWRKFAELAEDDALEAEELASSGLGLNFQTAALDALAAIYAKHLQISASSNADKIKYQQLMLDNTERAYQLRPAAAESVVWRLSSANAALQLMTLVPAEREKYRQRGLQALRTLTGPEPIGAEKYKRVEQLRQRLR